MQGRLQESPITVRIESPCAECARPVLIDVDEELRWEVAGPGLRPFILEPSVDWSRFTEPSILHAY